jgi:hypothetical protein
VLLNQIVGLKMNNKIIKVKIDIIRDRAVDNTLLFVFKTLALYHSDLLFSQLHSILFKIYLNSDFISSLSSSKKIHFIIPK